MSTSTLQQKRLLKQKIRQATSWNPCQIQHCLVHFKSRVRSGLYWWETKNKFWRNEFLKLLQALNHQGRTIFFYRQLPQRLLLGRPITVNSQRAAYDECKVQFGIIHSKIGPDIFATSCGVIRTPYVVTQTYISWFVIFLFVISFPMIISGEFWPESLTWNSQFH